MNKSLLIAFDFDGVIADTIAMLRDTFASFVSEYSIAYSDELFEKYNGVTFSEMIKDLKELYTLECDKEELLVTYQAKVDENIKYIKPTTGLVETLEMLKTNGVKMIVASSAKKDYIELFLRNNNLYIFFDEIFSGESCPYSKTDYRYYLNIKEKYKEYDVFVVEDSENGLISAFNAGLITILFNQSGRLVRAPYHYSIDSLYEVYNIIDKQRAQGFFIKNNDVELIVIDNDLTFSDDENSEIEEMWSRRPEYVFNGKVLACSSLDYDGEKLFAYCYITEYKYIYAMRHKIIPISVSGIVIDSNGKTIAAVRKEVTDYCDTYELIPSGGIDERFLQYGKKSYIKQLKNELHEEIGPVILEEKILSIDTMGVCYDAQMNTLDICMKIMYTDDFAKINFEYSNKEYNLNKIIVEDVKRIKKKLMDKKVVFASKMMLDQL